MTLSLGTTVLPPSGWFASHMDGKSPVNQRRNCQKWLPTSWSSRPSQCERALKKAIIHSKNMRLHKAPDATYVGAVFMNFIASAKLAPPQRRSPPSGQVLGDGQEVIQSRRSGRARQHRPQGGYAELNGVDPFVRIAALLSHHREVDKASPDWRPWTYRDDLTRLASATLPR